MKAGTKLRVGDWVAVDGTHYRIVRQTGAVATLAPREGPSLTATVADLLAGHDVEVLTVHADDADDVPQVCGFDDDSFVIDRAPPEQVAWAERMYPHVVEVSDCVPRPGCGPDRRYAESVPVSQRERHKVDELAGTDLEVSLRSLQRYRQKVRDFGFVGLLDQRRAVVGAPWGKSDPVIVETLQRMLDERAGHSLGTVGGLLLDFEDELRVQLGISADDEITVKVPSNRTLRRLVNQMSAVRGGMSSSARQDSVKHARRVSYSHKRATRPGQVVLLDSTRFDVLCKESEREIAVELTIAVDLYTRAVLAWRITPTSTKAVDVSMLIADVMTPQAMRPGWTESARFAYSLLPTDRLFGLDERLEAASSRPVVWPETILYDHGKVFISKHIRRVCRDWGINLQPSRKGTPTDKAIVERMFRTINDQFAQHVAGYKGSNTVRRGKRIHTQFSIAQLEELLAEWVVCIYHNRPHSALRLPWAPEVDATPHEMWAEGVSAAGYIRCPAGSDLYVSMLPVVWRKVTHEGVSWNSRTYDASALDPLREPDSGIGCRGGKHPVHVDPRDIRQVWVIDPRTGEAIEAPWVYADRFDQPFADSRWKAQQRIAAARLGRPGTEQEVFRQYRDLRRRAGRPDQIPEPLSRSDVRDDVIGSNAETDRERHHNDPDDGEGDVIEFPVTDNTDEFEEPEESEDLDVDRLADLDGEHSAWRTP